MVMLLGVLCNIFNMSVTMETFTAKHVDLIKHNIKLYIFYEEILIVGMMHCLYMGKFPQTQIYYLIQHLLGQNHFYHLRMETGTKYWSAGLKCLD